MFTGIVQTTAKILSVSTPQANGSVRITLQLKNRIGRLRLGDSIAVDGICLTIASERAQSVHCDVIPETLAKTIAHAYTKGGRVNIESAARWGSPISGHLVSGHIDGIGSIQGITQNPKQGLRVHIKIPAPLKKLCIDRGSIAVNGVSLTIASLTAQGIVVALTPTTIALTTFSTVTLGQQVNIEIDQFAKTIYHFLHTNV